MWEGETDRGNLSWSVGKGKAVQHSLNFNLYSVEMQELDPVLGETKCGILNRDDLGEAD